MSVCQAKDPENCRYHNPSSRPQDQIIQQKIKIDSLFNNQKAVPAVVKDEVKETTVVKVKARKKITWNKDIESKISSVISDIQPTEKGVLSNLLERHAADEGIDIDYAKFSAQAISSHMGKILELVYEAHAEKALQDNPKITYVRGDALSKEISLIRKSQDESEIRTFKNKLIKEYRFTEEYADAIIQKGKPIHLPDAFVIDKTKRTPVIKCCEMKASGHNDSASIPANIEKMMHNTENSAIEAWKNNDKVKVETAILITAGKMNSKKTYIHKKKWETSIAANDKAIDTLVFCNKEAYEWLSGEKLTKKQYKEDFMSTVARIELTRIAKAQNTPLLSNS